MEFKVGDAVINQAMPQWGTGDVLHVEGNRAVVDFHRYGVRRMAVSFLAMADTGECPEPAPRSRSAAPRPASPAVPPSLRPSRPSAPSSAPASQKRARPAPEDNGPQSAASASPDTPSGLVAQALAMLGASSGAAPRDAALQRAEQALELDADIRRKAREDKTRRIHAALLRFWRDAEIFLIPDVPRSSRPPVGTSRRWETVSPSLPVADREALAPEGAELPWERPLPGGFALAWHIVYLGVLPRQRLSDLILEKTGSEADKPEEPGTGEGCLAAVVLDATGVPLEGSFMAASFVPGLARCLAGKGLDQLTVDMIALQAAFDRRSATDNGPFRRARIHEEIQRLFALMGVEGEEERMVVRSVYFRPDPKGRRQEEVQNDLLNSFYLTDLDYLLNLAPQGFCGIFARWLEPVPDEAGRIDVLDGSEAALALLEKDLSLENLPRGRWPFPPGRQLLPAQAAAVSEILRGSLTAVNGPPGTGKTRLLCDVIAAVVVERASRLARLRQPFEVFSSSMGDFHTLRPELMRGTCLVVAGSNNAAVENITRELPAESAVSLEDFPDAAYFPDVAGAVATAFAGPDREEGICRSWGLLAAVLGSAWNCEQFARALFWGFRDPEQKISLPGMKQVLDEWRSYERHQEAREQWLKTRDEFLRVSTLLDRHMDSLARRPAVPDAAPGPDPASMLDQFMELMARSRALRSTAREEDSAARDLALRLEELENVARRAQAELDRQRTSGAEPLRVPGRDFLHSGDWQRTSVWNDAELDRLRTRLFLLGLRLHEWTIKACAREFSTNLSTVTRFLRGSPEEDLDTGALWNALFFVVPVVSSTLASFSRLFSGMGAQSLDWVLLDEAGQAAPQSAAGALWRARRAAVIGDPQQIEPVVAQPAPLLAHLRQRQEQGFSLAPWSPESQSAQTLADRAATRGTWMSSGGRRLWTGFPLRVHYRCSEPMFSVANRIAYDGQMLQAQRDLPQVHSPLGESCWFHVDGRNADTHLVREELACLHHLLMAMVRDWPRVETPGGGRDAGVFVISPFRKVAWHCRTLVRNLRLPEERVRCGTIHTFQGREADIVFLVLGSSPGPAGRGSRQWASRTPNILNVALTRARSLLYVIGNRRDWQRHPFFDILAEELPVRPGLEGHTLSGPTAESADGAPALSPLFRSAGAGPS